MLSAARYPAQILVGTGKLKQGHIFRSAESLESVVCGPRLTIKQNDGPRDRRLNVKLYHKNDRLPVAAAVVRRVSRDSAWIGIRDPLGFFPKNSADRVLHCHSVEPQLSIHLCLAVPGQGHSILQRICQMFEVVLARAIAHQVGSTGDGPLLLAVQHVLCQHLTCVTAWVHVLHNLFVCARAFDCVFVVSVCL